MIMLFEQGLINEPAFSVYDFSIVHDGLFSIIAYGIAKSDAIIEKINF
jgi:hypothetical protein